MAAACAGPGTSDVDRVATRDSAGVTIVEYPRSVLSSIPTWQLGGRLTALGGHEADATHDMTGAQLGLLEGAGFLVGDRTNMQLRRFSLSGELLGTGAGMGEGPGELSYLGALFPTTDGIAVVDPLRGALVLYDDSLRFQRRVNLRELPGGEKDRVLAIERGDVLYAIGGPESRPGPAPDGRILRDLLVVERLDLASGLVDTLFSLPSGEFYYLGGGTRGRRFAMRPIVHRTSTGFVSSAGERWQVLTHDGGGTVHRLLRLDWPRRPVTEPMRTAQLRLDQKEIDDLPAGGFGGIRRMAAMDFADPRFPDSLPPFDTSVLGRDGVLWVREGVSPTDTLQRWLVIVGDSLLAKLVMPIGLTLLDARRDRLLLRHSDSLGLGYVEVRSIEAGP